MKQDLEKGYRQAIEQKVLIKNNSYLWARGIDCAVVLELIETIEKMYAEIKYPSA